MLQKYFSGHRSNGVQQGPGPLVCRSDHLHHALRLSSILQRVWRQVRDQAAEDDRQGEVQVPRQLLEPRERGGQALRVPANVRRPPAPAHGRGGSLPSLDREEQKLELQRLLALHRDTISLVHTHIYCCFISIFYHVNRVL